MVSITATLTYAPAPPVPLAVTISTHPVSPVIIGDTVTNSFTTDAGRAPYTVVWQTRFSDDEDWVEKSAASPYVWIANFEATLQIKLTVTDADGLTGTKTITVNVQGPDDLQPTASINSESNGGGPGTTLQVTHKFIAKRGEKVVATGWSTTAYEWISQKNLATGEWEDGPPGPNADTWAAGGGLESSGPEDEPGYYFHSPVIVDIKRKIAPMNWLDTPDDETVGEYKQWVAIKVPICGDPDNTHRFVWKGPFHFQIKKVTPDKLKHVLQQ